MMIVDIDLLKKIKAQLKEINSVPLDDLVFIEGGEVIDVPQEWLDDWKYVGLNNTDFITSGCYKKGFDKLRKV